MVLGILTFYFAIGSASKVLPIDRWDELSTLLLLSRPSLKHRNLNFAKFEFCEI